MVVPLVRNKEKFKNYGGYTMSYKCELVDKKTQPVLTVRTRTAMQELPQFFAKAYGAIAQYLGELGEQPAGAPFAAYYNMDMQDLDVEAGFPVRSSLPAKGEIHAGEIAGGKYATRMHQGPYDKVEPAYTALAEFLKQKRLEATGVAYEIYLNDPASTPAQELMTQIMFPIK